MVKVKPIRDKKYLDFIRSLPCLIGGSYCPGSEAHHEALPGHGTMGGKPGDDQTLPLCCQHHAFGGTPKHPGSRHGQARLTGRAFWQAYGVDPEEWIVKLNSAFEKVAGRKVGEGNNPEARRLAGVQ